MKKVKLNEGTSDFMLTEYTTITGSKLAPEKVITSVISRWFWVP